jgi:ubiquinone/menaquinone biosynthesis C-methylase UbiE
VSETATVPRRQHNIVSVAEGYELWAPTYDVDPNPLLSAEERALKPLLNSAVDKVVLDVACGTGRWLKKLLHAGARSGAGIDISRAMLGVARAKSVLRGHLVKGDCVRLPFRSKFADLIVSSFALGHISDPDALARELARVATNGAHLWVSDLHPEARARGWATGFRHQRGNAEISAYCHSIEQVHKMFSAHGFNVLESHNVRLGQPEFPIFQRAGKSHIFETACDVPAVSVVHFKRTNPCWT